MKYKNHNFFEIKVKTYRITYLFIYLTIFGYRPIMTILHWMYHILTAIIRGILAGICPRCIEGIISVFVCDRGKLGKISLSVRSNIIPPNLQDEKVYKEYQHKFTLGRRRYCQCYPDGVKF